MKGLQQARNVSKYLDFLVSNKLNYMRMWTSESVRNRSRATTFSHPMSWVQSGTCCAADRGNKFDLKTFDVGNLASPDVNSSHYFERLRARVLAAQAKGIYVSIMLYHANGTWNNAFGSSSVGWTFHPFKSNNVIGINGDENGGGQGYELQLLGQAFTSRQDDYVRQVVDAVIDLDAVS